MAITLTSTTDTEAQVAAALGLDGDTPANDQAADSTAAARSESGADSGTAKSGSGSKPVANSRAGDRTPKSASANAGTKTTDNDDSPDDDASDASGTGKPAKQAGGQAAKPKADDDDTSSGDDDQDDDDDDDQDDDKQPDADAQVKAGAGADDSADTSVKPRRKGGFQQKIDKLTREKYEVQAREMLAQNELNRLRAQLTANAGASAKPVDQPVPAAKSAANPAQASSAAATTLRIQPRLADFPTYEAFLEDSQKWIAEAREHDRAEVQRLVEEQTTRTRAELEQQRNDEKRDTQRVQAAAQFQSREAQFVIQHPDYQETINNSPVKSEHLTPAMRQVMLVHETGPALAYWYATNPSEVIRLAQLPESLQLLQLGQITERLATSNTKPGAGSSGNTGASPTSSTANARKKSAAPKPAGKASASVASSANSTHSYSSAEKMSFRDYAKARDEGRIR